MRMLTKGLLANVLGKESPGLSARTRANVASKAITNQGALQEFQANPENTFIISFPRTGSHWLRMVMELYFGRPSLTRVFYYPDRSDYLSLHTHDLELDVVRSHVIYLYRDPVDTIYSQLQYHKEDVSDGARITYWSDLYGRHLDKWLHRENSSTKKTIIRYENMKSDMQKEFQKLCEHFGTTLDADVLNAAASQVTRHRVQAKTAHDPQVMNTTRQYREQRDRFVRENGEFVWQVLLNGRDYLRKDF